MKTFEKYLMRFITLLFLSIGYFGLFYGTGEYVDNGIIYAGVFGLMTWTSWDAGFD